MALKFTLVIPVAPDRGAEILNSIKKLDYPKSEFNVIVVKGKNPSKNRNKGSKKAKGDIIVFLDDDAVIEENYLRNAQKFFKDYPYADIVGGVQLTPQSDKGFARISGYALGSKFGAWKISNRYSGKKIILDADETMLTSANLICKKKVFEKIKFDVGLFPGEDPKFIAYAKASGFKIAYYPDLVIYHRRRPSASGMIKQIFLYGKTRPKKENFLETLYKRPFFLIPSIFIIYLSLLIILMIINSPLIKKNIFLWFFPIISYIFLAILFSIYESAKNKDYKTVFLLPFIYPMIHISYGAGFLVSTAKNLFKNLSKKLKI